MNEQARDETAWVISSETGKLRDVLLCPPIHYDWIATNDIARLALSQGKRIDRQRLAAQFRELEDALDRAGVVRHYLEPTPGLPYQVYTRDSSQVTPWGVVLTQLERPQRRGEIGAVLDFYQSKGFGIWRHATAGSIEGGDIHVIRPGLLAIGVSGGRTDLRGARQFASWFEHEGWDVILVPFPEHFLHLDVLFCMIGEDLALAAADILDDAFLDWLEGNGIDLLTVGYKEAVHGMACNVLALGEDRVISPFHGTRVNEMLRAEGFEVLAPHLDLFATGGGSVHCMTMPLRRD